MMTILLLTLLVLSLIYILVTNDDRLTEYYNGIKHHFGLISPKKDPRLERLRKKLQVVHPAFKDVKIFRGDKSYTINKEKVYICTKDHNNEYYEDNMLIYVLLHEMAHVLNDTIGHTPEFFEKFDELKTKAIELSIYDPTIPIDPNYCEF